MTSSSYRYLPGQTSEIVVDMASINRPWVDWERCAISASADGPWRDLPRGTLDHQRAKEWARMGKLELRKVPSAGGGVFLEARPTGNGS
jgi:hypothetical protein